PLFSSVRKLSPLSSSLPSPSASTTDLRCTYAVRYARTLGHHQDDHQPTSHHKSNRWSSSSPPSLRISPYVPSDPPFHHVHDYGPVYQPS
ncbi:hypothetical protein CSPAE12_07034, partial [Colletotrichum incanum]